MSERAPLAILYHHRTQGRGVERVHVMGMVDAWRKAGHQVDVVSPPGVDLEARDADARRDRRPSVLGALARHLPALLFESMEIAYNVRGLAALRRRHGARRYDLVYERYAYLNLAGFRTARAAGVPFVLEVNFTSSTAMSRRRSRAARWLERRVERHLFPRADLCVAVSSRLKDLLLEAGVSPSRILVQPNAADPDRFDPSRRADALRASLGLDGKLVVGFVGYFSKWHGVELLCEAFQVVRRSVPAAVCILVGDGPTHAEISAMVRDRGWAQSMRLPGRVSSQEVPDYVALFDVAVMPGSNDYGSPMKIPEYMAAGKPVVAPRLGPILELLDDGRTGILFDQGAVSQLADALVALLNDPARRARIGNAARGDVERLHNWDVAAARVLARVDTIGGDRSAG